MAIVVMRVGMYCGCCERKVRKTLSQLQGVDNVEIDMARQKVTVTGHVDCEKVLDAVRQCGRKPKLSHYSDDVECTCYTDPNHETQTFDSTYNYSEHGYNGSSHGYYHVVHCCCCAVVHKFTYYFSDENTHACSIM
ncbi:hypothetical protein SUGI_0854610 [Cryptomeria japonica]|uniref:heavy metal-associated isoprenylated plant protein 28 n=1 Tax=Cryptomeria japonica TaxID=3369 RepID=UPI002414A76F|nr:heavy metal-associated isoprenylated plant protein 28 [Cryptomeria japonica]GLJ41285.1 hypothetical protein SUGI_0854610 [Cryptomeria japonica]